MPVQTEVFDALCVVLVKANSVRLEHEVQHDQQADEDVKTVCASGDVENLSLHCTDGKSFSNQVAPLNEFEHNEQGTEQKGSDEVISHCRL